jgi:FkbM family methyltransferase
MDIEPRNEVIGLPLFLYGVYEISSTRFLQGVLRPGMTLVDVGANSGYYSLIGARLVGSHGHVHAFEPIVEISERLRRSVALNGFRNVSIHQAAIASSAGRSVIYPSALPNNDGVGSLLPGPGRAVSGVEIELVALDDLLGALRGGCVDVIKVDVEGGEADVFAGAETLLSGPNAPALVFESFSVSPSIESLAKFGYEVRHANYSLQNGLEFPRIGEAFDNLFCKL